MILAAGFGIEPPEKVQRDVLLDALIDGRSDPASAVADCSARSSIEDLRACSWAYVDPAHPHSRTARTNTLLTVCLWCIVPPLVYLQVPCAPHRDDSLAYSSLPHEVLLTICTVM